MFGPYSAKIVNGQKIIEYLGNKVSEKKDNISVESFDEKILDNRVDDLINKKRYYHLHKIDNAIFFSATEYFKEIGAEWCNLPLTTLMISSPGEVYRGKTLDYTTETLPVDISWFNNRKIFLSESSQFYLELRLLLNNIDKVFSIYNSFRKERADFCHLSEFQHIEFEGHISFQENIDIFLGLLKHIIKHILKKNRDDLLYFLADKEIESLDKTFDSKNILSITFKEALDILFKETKDPLYKKFSMKNFGAWEEIKLTEISKKHVLVKEFPSSQIPFYHNISPQKEGGIEVAENADLILYRYREVIGSGVRISDPKLLSEKAKIFNLPMNDYLPYLKMRTFNNYKPTAGFGLGWQRYTHWLLKLPYIWEASHVPRGHHLPRP